MGFFRDLEDDIKELGRDIDDQILQPIKENPIGAIVSVGGMALGIPPIYAGALGGAAGAAAGGGDILKGAVLGGVGGYVGGAAAGAAANAGAGTVLSSAAGGAAAGAAGAALTGGDILKGALTGGAMGAASGYIKSEFFSPEKQTYTRTYDDGSTIEYTADGDVLGTTPATDANAPVFEYNPQTGQIEPVGGTPRLNELTSEQTQDLINRNVSPGMIDNLTDTGAVGGEEVPFRAEVVGTPATADNPNPAVAEFRTPGTELATWDQIDAGQAGWNSAANAWEVMPKYVGPETYTFDDGSTFTFNPDGTTSYTDSLDQTFAPGGGQAYASEGGATTYTFDDGSWMTINPDGSSVVSDSMGRVTTHAGGTYSGAGTRGEVTDLGELEITAPRLPTDVTDLGELQITAPRLPGTSITAPPGTTQVGPGTIDYPGAVNTPTPVTPIFPVVTPGGGTGGNGGGTTTGPATPGSPIKAINLPGGLNPGFMNPTPFYNTFDDAQSKFSWGARAFQPGPTFDANLYNAAPAPQTPWGAQQIAQPLSPEQFARAAQGLPVAQQPVQAAQRVRPAGPVAPAPMTVAGPSFTPQQIANTPGMGSNGIGVNIQPIPVMPPPPVTQFVTGPGTAQFVTGPSVPVVR